MRFGKLLVVLTLLMALTIPQIVFAGVNPTSNVQLDRKEMSVGDLDLRDGSGDIQDRRGRVRWFGNLFWWQIEALRRYVTRWSGVV